MKLITEENVKVLQQWGNTQRGVSFKDITTIRIGGNISLFFIPFDIASLQAAIKYMQLQEIAYKVIGRGSDLVCGDKTYEGCVIRLDRINEVKIQGNKIYAGAGVIAMRLAKELARQGLSGFEFASAIPGSIGGMAYMNAGAYKTSMQEVVKSVYILDQCEVRILQVEECDYGYRHSIFQKHPEWTILGVEMILQKKNPQEILALMEDRARRRQESQPLNIPSAGSCFRNPESDYSWRYIEGIGFRGYHYGGMQVSEKHPNFMLNVGDASSQDFMELTTLIQKKVKEKYGVELMREIELFHCEGNDE